MLYSVDSGKYVKDLPHLTQFSKWMHYLSTPDYQLICDELNSRIDASDIQTASWIPGHNWANTVFQPIFDACNYIEEAAGMFFGLILFQILKDRTDHVWGFGRYEKDGVPIKGMTYFILKNPPPIN